MNYIIISYVCILFGWILQLCRSIMRGKIHASDIRYILLLLSFNSHLRVSFSFIVFFFFFLLNKFRILYICRVVCDMWEISTFYSIKTIYIYIYIYMYVCMYIYSVIRGKYWLERIWVHCYHHFFISNILYIQKFMKQSQFHLWFSSLFKF